MRRRKKKKIETSKILLLVSDVMATAVLIGTVAAVFVLQDATPLAYLIPAGFGLAAPSHGLHPWKAKAEHLSKWGQGDKVTMKEEEDPTQWNG